MAKVYEHIAVSDHIRFAPFPHAAFEKGDLVTIGAMRGIADTASASGEAVEIDCGTPRAVFRAGTNDVAGSPAVGGAVYIDGEALTMTASGPVYGVITYFDAAVVEFAVAGV